MCTRERGGSGGCGEGGGGGCGCGEGGGGGCGEGGGFGGCGEGGEDESANDFVFFFYREAGHIHGI